MGTPKYAILYTKQGVMVRLAHEDDLPDELFTEEEAFQRFREFWCGGASERKKRV